MLRYLIVFASLFAAELLYFSIARHLHIVDRPNERSSHGRAALRGGGIIFTIAVWIWSAVYGLHYPWFLAGLTLIAGVSFIDDIRSLPVSVRLLAQFIAMGLMFWQLGILQPGSWWIVLIALVVCVGITNAFNFMDGINGITGGYSLTVLLPLLLLDRRFSAGQTLLPDGAAGFFIDPSFLVVSIFAVLVFCFFNFRRNARCFAGDVGSVGIAFITVFALGKLMLWTGDFTYIVFLAVYGVDSVLTICHRILLRENLGVAHRKHAYQLMANELGMPHVLVSLIYMLVQSLVSLGMVLIPATAAWHWGYLAAVLAVLAAAYLLFMKKYYHLHEEYLKTLSRP